MSKKSSKSLNFDNKGLSWTKERAKTAAKTGKFVVLANVDKTRTPMKLSAISVKNRWYDTKRKKEVVEGDKEFVFFTHPELRMAGNRRVLEQALKHYFGKKDTSKMTKANNVVAYHKRYEKARNDDGKFDMQELSRLLMEDPAFRAEHENYAEEYQKATPNAKRERNEKALRLLIEWAAQDKEERQFYYTTPKGEEKVVGSGKKGKGKSGTKKAKSKKVRIAGETFREMFVNLVENNNGDKANARIFDIEGFADVDEDERDNFHPSTIKPPKSSKISSKVKKAYVGGIPLASSNYADYEAAASYLFEKDDAKTYLKAVKARFNKLDELHAESAKKKKDGKTKTKKTEKEEKEVKIKAKVKGQ